MKKFALLFLLLLCGCAGTSTTLTEYRYISYNDLATKVRTNNKSQVDMYDIWRYAGSDDQYDYVYEFTPGIFLGPNTNYQYYKIDKGQLKLDVRYPFKPDPKKNTEIFTW